MALFVCSSYTLQAQENKIAHFDQSSGLTETWIHSALLDNEGYLWLGTQGGVSRYDGESFFHLKEQYPDTMTLSGNIIKGIYQENDSLIWFCSQGAGLDCINKKTGVIRHFYSNNDERENFGNRAFTSFLTADADHFWIGCYEEGLCYAKKDGTVCDYIKLEEKDHSLHSDRFLYNSVNDLLRISTIPNTLFLAANNLGILRFNERTRERKTYPVPSCGSLTGTAAMKLFSDTPNDLWIGTWSSGLVHFDLATEKMTPFPMDIEQYKNSNPMANVVTGITRKNKYELWVATLDQGLFVFNTSSHKYTAFYDPNIQIPSRLTGLYKDRLNRLYVLTERQGVYLIQAPYDNFEQWQIDTKQADDGHPVFVRAFAMDPITRATFFVFDRAKVVLRFYQNGHIDSFPILPQPFSAQVFTTLFTDSRGWTWLSATQGNHGTTSLWLRKKDNDTFSEFKGFSTNKKNFAFDITCITEDKQKRLWLGTNDNGLMILNPKDESIQHIVEIKDCANYSKNIRVTDIAEDSRDGSMWVSTEYSSVYLIKSTGESSIHIPVGVSKENCIRSEIFLNDSILWLGTSGSGIQYFNTNIKHLQLSQFKDSLPLYQRESGLSDDKISKMVADSYGHLWVSSLFGLSMFNEEKKSFTNFLASEGLKDPFLMDKGLWAHPDGWLFIGQDNGFLRKKIDRNTVRIANPNASIKITDFRVLNKSILIENIFKWPQKVELEPSENIITIHFSDLEFFSGKNMRYAWILEGLETETQYCVGCKRASYSNIKGGSYCFKVWIVNEKGERTSPNTASFYFSISLRFYEQWWFFPLLILTFGLLIYQAYTIRIKRLNKKNKRELREAEFRQNEAELKAQISETRHRASEIEMAAMRAQMNPHFIFNCLNSINTFILLNEPDRASDYLTKFSKLIRLVLDHSRSNLIPLESELNTLGFYIELEQMRFDNSFDFEILLGPNINTYEIDIPPLILQPFLENAIWHGLHHKTTGRGHLSLKVFLVDREFQQYIHFIIEDNGVGRKKASELKSKSATHRKSHGTRITSERMESISAIYGIITEMHITDLFNKDGSSAGTRVTLWIPANI